MKVAPPASAAVQALRRFERQMDAYIREGVWPRAQDQRLLREYTAALAAEVEDMDRAARTGRKPMRMRKKEQRHQPTWPRITPFTHFLDGYVTDAWGRGPLSQEKRDVLVGLLDAMADPIHALEEKIWEDEAQRKFEATCNEGLFAGRYLCHRSY
jgi:hypothetical protein